MPIYEYRCQSGHIHEFFQKVNDPAPAECPSCGTSLAKLVSRNSFQLKGGGWYHSDYTKTSESDEPNGSKGGSKSPGASANNAHSCASGSCGCSTK